MAQVDLNRVDDIAAQIRAACSPILGMDQARNDAKDVLAEAGTAATQGREGIMVSLAALSHAGGWTDAEIRAAAGKAAAMSNNKSDKALATFIGETKRAMHPGVCQFVPDFMALRDEVWDGEADAKAVDKDLPTPIKDAFIRKYHMLITLLGEAGEGNMLTTPDMVTAYAVAHDPAHDAAKVAKKLEKIVADLRAVWGNFALDDIQAAIQSLDDVTKKRLEAVARPVAVTNTVVGGVTIPTVVRTMAPAAAVHTDTVESNDTGIDAASDILDGIMLAA